MTKTIEVTLYQFDELNDKAKEKARENYITNWMSDDWYDCTYEYMKEEGEHKHGFRVDDIRFSGFCSQGDGASWCGIVMVREFIGAQPTEYQHHPTTQIVLALIDEGWVDEYVRVTYNDHWYSHEYTMQVEVIGYHEPVNGEVLEHGMMKGADVSDLLEIVGCAGGALYDMSKEIEEDCRSFARDIYRELEADYDGQTTDEAIAESYAINDVWFDESGAVA